MNKLQLLQLTAESFLNPHPGLARSRISGHGFASLLNIADREWQGMLLFGRYCRMTLGECSGLCHDDFVCNYAMMAPSCWRDSGPIVTPLGPTLVYYLLSLPATSDPDSAIFPVSCAKSIATLESEFEALAVEAKLSPDACCHGFAAVYFSFNWIAAQMRGLDQCEANACRN